MCAEADKDPKEKKHARQFLLADPNNPTGWFHWSYGYDTVGRTSSLTYPRRDEGYPSTVGYS